jgi:hypothetical protein
MTDRQGGNLEADLRKAVPDYADVYFDNVGGETLDIMLTLVKRYGKVACCGAISRTSPFLVSSAQAHTFRIQRGGAIEAKELGRNRLQPSPRPGYVSLPVILIIRIHRRRLHERLPIRSAGTCWLDRIWKAGCQGQRADC